MNFTVDDNLGLTSTISPSHSIYESGNKISVYGELMGAVSENQIFYPEDVFRIICEKKSNSSSLNKFLRTLVGKCYVILESKEKITLLTSPSSPGLFYTKVDDTLILSEDESFIYKYADLDKLDEIELLNTIISNQGLIRMPFSTPFGNLKRIVGGCSLLIDRSLNTSYDLFLMKSSKELVSINNSDFINNYKKFSFLLEGTLKLITDFYENKDIFLAKSGGIDSSVLLAALSKIDAKFLPVHIPYNNINSISEKTAVALCKIFNIEMDVMPLSDKKDKQQILIDNKNKAKQGLGTVTGPQYLKVNPKKYFNDKISGEESNLITGQNLDSLYFINTFAPGSNVVGFTRLFGIVSTIKNRIYFSKTFLGDFDYKWILKLWPFCIKKTKLKKNFKEYLYSFVSPFYDHVVPLHNNRLLPKELTKIENKYRDFKHKKIIKPILDMYQSKCGKNVDFENISLADKNHLIRISRWCRYIQNVHLNYYNLRKADKINWLTPFSEGPLANYFLTYQLTIKDTLYIKRLCHTYFYNNSGIKFYQIARNFSGNIIYNLARISYQFLKKLPKVNKIIITFKRKIFTSKEQIEEYKNAIEILNQIKSKKFIWGYYQLDSAIKDYIKVDEKIINEKITISDKAKMMELSRLINLELFLESFQSN